MAEQSWPRPTNSLWSGLSILLIIGLVTQLALAAASSQELWTGVLTPEALEDPNVILVGLVALLFLVIWALVFLLCVVYTCRITFRMMKNLEALDAPGMRTSPTMAVVWYFIPIANLYLPFRAFKQIWDGTFSLTSEPAPGDGVALAWWITWVLSNITGSISFRMSLQAGGMNEIGPSNPELYLSSLWVGLASSLLGAISCWFMLKSFGPVSRAQDALIAARGPSA